MRKPNYNHAKKQKEQARKQRQQEKQQKREKDDKAATEPGVDNPAPRDDIESPSAA